MTAPRKNYQMNQENASERFLERTNRISSEESPGDVPSIRKSRKEILGKNLQRLTDKDPQRTNPPLPSPPIHHISAPVPAPPSQNPRPRTPVPINICSESFREPANIREKNFDGS